MNLFNHLSTNKYIGQLFRWEIKINEKLDKLVEIYKNKCGKFFF